MLAFRARRSVKACSVLGIWYSMTMLVLVLDFARKKAPPFDGARYSKNKYYNLIKKKTTMLIPKIRKPESNNAKENISGLGLST